MDGWMDGWMKYVGCGILGGGAMHESTNCVESTDGGALGLGLNESPLGATLAGLSTPLLFPSERPGQKVPDPDLPLYG
uniref:Uncharacterized protein n=1 Tax=Physcomitrium patens TaxID=3218 RepID=A0A2K1J6M9_PHYPA|nr:hypothetical protein PHYPA_020284 [Physcomitrium patens]